MVNLKKKNNNNKYWQVRKVKTLYFIFYFYELNKIYKNTIF